MAKHLVADNADPRYGSRCPECGDHKSLTAAMCRTCRSRKRTGVRVKADPCFAADALSRVWPMPTPFPPVCAQPPRAHASIVWDVGD